MPNARDIKAEREPYYPHQIILVYLRSKLTETRRAKEATKRLWEQAKTTASNLYVDECQLGLLELELKRLIEEYENQERP